MRNTNRYTEELATKNKVEADKFVETKTSQGFTTTCIEFFGTFYATAWKESINE